MCKYLNRDHTCAFDFLWGYQDLYRPKKGRLTPRLAACVNPDPDWFCPEADCMFRDATINSLAIRKALGNELPDISITKRVKQQILNTLNGGNQYATL